MASLRVEKFNEKMTTKKQKQFDKRKLDAIHYMLSLKEFDLSKFTCDYLIISLKLKILMDMLKTTEGASENQKKLYEEISQRLMSVEEGIIKINPLE